MSERDDDILEEGEGGQHEPPVDSLSDEIIQRYSPERLLRMVSGRAGKGERLDVTTRNKFERRLGVDLSDVRVYSGEFAKSVTDAHNAEAVTIGTTGMILMGGSADKSPATASGRALLAHELTHVAQAHRSLHRSATFGDTPELATEEHEAEAEAMELEELNAEGGNDVRPEAEMTEAEFIDARRQAVMRRVLELVEEDERVYQMRGGKSKFRP